MQKAYIVRLTPNEGKNDVNLDEKQVFGKEHHQYIESLTNDNTLLFGGPIEGKKGGMLVFNLDSEEKVREVMNKDPMIKHGYVNIEINQWKISHNPDNFAKTF